MSLRWRNQPSGGCYYTDVGGDLSYLGYAIGKDPRSMPEPHRPRIQS
jgi:hypothetical protein